MRREGTGVALRRAMRKTTTFRERLRRTSLLLPLILAACGFEPSGERPMDPPSQYRAWWAETEACSGVRGDFDRIDWYVIDGDGFECPSGTCAGRWQRDGRIFIAGEYAGHEMVVRHEMLHALLNRTGHPEREFKASCRLTWDTWTAEGEAERHDARLSEH
jgi:hypothetical protein